jgi:hypothetical protein
MNKELRAELAELAKKTKVEFPYKDKDRAFAQRMSHLRSNLKEFFNLWLCPSLRPDVAAPDFAVDRIQLLLRLTRALASVLETLVAAVRQGKKGAPTQPDAGLVAGAFGLDGVGYLTDQVVTDADGRGAAYGKDVAIDEKLVAPWVRRLQVAGGLDFDQRVGWRRLMAAAEGLLWRHSIISHRLSDPTGIEAFVDPRLCMAGRR